MSELVRESLRRVAEGSGAPVRAAAFTPSLQLGGAERWLVSLIRHSDPRQLRWTGAATGSARKADGGPMKIRQRGRLAGCSQCGSPVPLSIFISFDEGGTGGQTPQCPFELRLR